jgi:ubiquinone/menaquinone biosynthesis C-methylase UbiE
MKKTVESLLGTKFDFYWIEPSAWMRWIAEEKFQWDDRIKFIEWFAQDLPFENNSIDFIFDIQMQHHHTDEIKKEMIEEAYRVLKPWGNIYILDTYVPEWSNLISKIQRKVFAILQSGYVNSVKKWIYHNWFFTDTKTMLSSSWFEVNEDYSQWYKVFLWHILGFDFINQAIATKK